MKAIVLAAGKGERLRGIVDSIPKPMIRIKGKPILEHTIELLKSHGIVDIYINLHHLPDIIRDYFNNGEKWGVRITYSYENEILGTAGGVRKIVKSFMCNMQEDAPFLVIYGDNLYNYDLKGFMDFHFKKGGVATIGLYRKEGNLRESGVAKLNEDGLITEFIEKPKGKEVESNLVNTGIYILQPEILSFIPDGFSDFGMDIFPELLRRKIPIYGYVLEGTLIPVDTVELYKKATKNYGGEL